MIHDKIENDLPFVVTVSSAQYHADLDWICVRFGPPWWWGDRIEMPVWSIGKHRAAMTGELLVDIMFLNECDAVEYRLVRC